MKEWHKGSAETRGTEQILVQYLPSVPLLDVQPELYEAAICFNKISERILFLTLFGCKL